MIDIVVKRLNQIHFMSMDYVIDAVAASAVAYLAYHIAWRILYFSLFVLLFVWNFGCRVMKGSCYLVALCFLYVYLGFLDNECNELYDSCMDNSREDIRKRIAYYESYFE